MKVLPRLHTEYERFMQKDSARNGGQDGTENGGERRAPTGWRLGVDIGGTFTDLALEHGDGTFRSVKLLTTGAEPERAVLDGVAAACKAAGIGLADIRQIIHGTTLATNAMIERRGAETLFVTTEGFRDVLEMGSESRFEQYDLNIVKPQPLVRRARRLTVRERLDVNGDALIPLDEASVAPVLAAIADEGIESVAVGLLHSYANPAHERRLRELIHEADPDLPVSLSCEVSPEMREYRRFSTTVANAYVQPAVAAYLRRLERALAESGFAGALMVMLSNGGLATLDTAIRFPVRLVESGPAGGAIYAAAVARQTGAARAVSFDMGGTTAKICLIDDGRPQAARDFEVDRAYRFKRGSGLPLRIPVVEMVEIGAGGGSLCGVDGLGRIAVGPRSAGSDPGPACYGRGGSGATVTDADVALGRIDPAGFAGGTMLLNAVAAERALAADVGAPLDLDAATAALGIAEMVDENMANAAREHAVEHGKDFEGRTLIAFGGCAPLHAARVADKLGIDRIVVPRGAGVGSAIGFLRAPVAFEVARSLYQQLESLDAGAVAALLTAMRDEAAAFVETAAGAPPERVSYAAYMRYRGQSHEIAVPLPDKPPSSGDARTWTDAVADAYAAAYRRQYGPPIDGVPLEFVAWTVRAESEMDTAANRVEGAPDRDTSAAGQRRIVDTAGSGPVTARVFDRDRLRPGEPVAGPAVVVEAQTSTIVPPGFTLTPDAFGSLVLERQAEKPT